MDRNRPPSGVRRKLESVGVRCQSSGAVAEIRSYSNSGHAGGDNQMTTFKLIVSAAIVALVANAALPTLVNVDAECEAAPECVQQEIVE